MRAKRRKAKIAMKCGLKVNICHVREALKSQNRYEMRAENVNCPSLQTS